MSLTSEKQQRPIADITFTTGFRGVGVVLQRNERERNFQYLKSFIAL
jgi:hypothetical protein